MKKVNKRDLEIKSEVITPLSETQNGSDGTTAAKGTDVTGYTCVTFNEKCGFDSHQLCTNTEILTCPLPTLDVACSPTFECPPSANCTASQDNPCCAISNHQSCDCVTVHSKDICVDTKMCPDSDDCANQSLPPYVCETSGCYIATNDCQATELC